nr:TniQ family protein [Mesorhizobium sp.]
MTMAGQVLTPLLLPLRENAGRNRSTWMQYCPLCFVADEAPYFRRRWRLATRISCFVHGCGLRDRCPACRSGIASFGQSELIPQHFCARCGFDLRRAAKVSVKAAARLLERCIDDICKVEMAKGSTMIGSLVSRLLRAPVVAGVGSGKTLTNLSAAARIRCFEQLAAKPYDWLVAGNDTAAAHWRHLILDAGGHDGLVARLADFMEKDRRSATPERFRLPDADLPALLEAYLRVMALRPDRVFAGERDLLPLADLEPLPLQS